MAEYTEVIKQFKRMCKSVTPIKCTRGECPMGCENIGQCRKVAFERPAKFEEQVMSWAAEHPEPVYPTWYEWLESEGILTTEIVPNTSTPYAASTMQSYMTMIKSTQKMYTPIPADIAQKLGIEPKEEK